MKKLNRILCLTIAVLMLFGILPAYSPFALEAAAAETVVHVTKMKELREYLESTNYGDDELTIVIDKNIDTKGDPDFSYHKYGDEGTIVLNTPVNGNKVIDLNGHNVDVFCESGTYLGSEQYEQTLFTVYGKLTVTDTSSKDIDKQGRINYRGRFVGARAADDGYNMGNPPFRVQRNIIEVENGGLFTLRGGHIVAGEQSKQWKSYRKWSTGTLQPGYLIQVCNGFGVTVRNGGTFICSGGSVLGRGLCCVDKEHRGDPYACDDECRRAALKADDGSTVLIYDGRFEGSCGADCLIISDKADCTVFNGEFNVSAPSDPILRGVDNIDPNWDVIGSAGAAVNLFDQFYIFRGSELLAKIAIGCYYRVKENTKGVIGLSASNVKYGIITLEDGTRIGQDGLDKYPSAKIIVAPSKGVYEGGYLVDNNGNIYCENDAIDNFMYTAGDTDAYLIFKTDDFGSDAPVDTNEKYYCEIYEMQDNRNVLLKRTVPIGSFEHPFNLSSVYDGWVPGHTYTMLFYVTVGICGHSYQLNRKLTVTVTNHSVSEKPVKEIHLEMKEDYRQGAELSKCKFSVQSKDNGKYGLGAQDWEISQDNVHIGNSNYAYLVIYPKEGSYFKSVPALYLTHGEHQDKEVKSYFTSHYVYIDESGINKDGSAWYSLYFQSTGGYLKMSKHTASENASFSTYGEWPAQTEEIQAWLHDSNCNFYGYITDATGVEWYKQDKYTGVIKKLISSPLEVTASYESGIKKYFTNQPVANVVDADRDFYYFCVFTNENMVCVSNKIDVDSYNYNSRGEFSIGIKNDSLMEGKKADTVFSVKEGKIVGVYGNLPSGLKVSLNGSKATISGTPSKNTAGVYQVAVTAQVYDSNGFIADEKTTYFYINVHKAYEYVFKTEEEAIISGNEENVYGSGVSSNSKVTIVKRSLDGNSSKDVGSYEIPVEVSDIEFGTWEQALTETVNEDGATEKQILLTRSLKINGKDAKQQIVMKKAHELIHYDAKAATCISTGMKEHFYCPECDKCYTDETEEQEITEDIIIPVDKNNHTGGTFFEGAEQSHTLLCEMCEKPVSSSEAHNLNEEYYCTECDYEDQTVLISADEVIELYKKEQSKKTWMIIAIAAGVLIAAAATALIIVIRKKKKNRF